MAENSKQQQATQVFSVSNENDQTTEKTKWHQNDMSLKDLFHSVLITWIIAEQHWYQIGELS